MIYVVVYDITNDKERERLSNYLMRYGIRVQESVFECNINISEYDKFIRGLKRFEVEGTKIKVYPLCNSCYKKVIKLGDLRDYPGRKGYEII